MSVLVARVSSLPGRAAAPAQLLAGLLAGAAVIGFLVVGSHASLALPVALLPLAALGMGRSRAVFAGVLLPAVALTLLGGHAFAEIKTGPVYILDVVLVCVVVLGLPAITDAAVATPALVLFLAFFMGVTLLEVVHSGLTRIVLRQSVIGLYAFWALVGVAAGRLGLSERIVRLVFWSGLGAAVLFGLTDLQVNPPFMMIGVAESLYVGYGLLALLLVPGLIPRGRWTVLVVGFEVVVIALGFVRSVWFALPMAVVVTLLVCGATPHVRRQIVRLLALGVVALVVTAVVLPARFEAMRAEASSIVFYNSGHSASDNNAKWRLNNWSYALSAIGRSPVGGIGFGQAEVPVSVCTNACNAPGALGDSTVLAGSDLHNSILAIPLRLGVPAFLAFLAFEGLVLVRARRSAMRSSIGRWLLACHLLTMFTALTAVVLEGPYMGIFFWLFAGLAIGFQPGAPQRTEAVGS